MTGPDAPVRAALAALAGGQSLDRAQMAGAVGVMLRGEATQAQIGALLLALRVRGETADEIAGAVAAVRTAMVPVSASGAHLVDTCGTGGGSVGTFNISTAAALVAAAAGANVAKHGNRALTSACGSADVLEALGVRILHDASTATRVLRECRIVCLFAPHYHPALKHIGAVRRELGVTTLMNLTGPLVNPANVRRQVIGVADPERAPIVAEALLRLGTDHALVVHGRAGLDEISPVGATDVWEVRDETVTHWTVDPAIYRLAIDDLAALGGGRPGDNAARIVGLLANGDRDPAGAAAVLLNGGAAIYVAGLAASFPEGIGRARHVLESGAARAVLEKWRRVSISTSA